MYATHLSEKVPGTQREVITSCDYGTCPTIKSNNVIITMIVVKSDENLQSNQAGRIHIDNNHYEPVEIRTLGVPLQ